MGVVMSDIKTLINTKCKQLGYSMLFAERDTPADAFEYSLALLKASGASEGHAITALAVFSNTLIKDRVLSELGVDKDGNALTTDG